MAFFDSEVSVFQQNDGSSLRNVSAGLVGVSGLPGLRSLNDVTALGDGGRKWSPGLEDITITLDAMYTDDANTGIDTVYGVLIRDDVVERAFDFGPEGTTSGMPKYSGNLFVESYTINSRVGNRVEATIVCKVNGKVTVGTY